MLQGPGDSSLAVTRPSLDYLITEATSTQASQLSLLLYCADFKLSGATPIFTQVLCGSPSLALFVRPGIVISM